MDGTDEAKSMGLAGTTDALVAEALSESPRYPNGTVFIDANIAASLPSALDAIREERAFVFVLPDGTEVAFEPRMDPVARIRRRLVWPMFRSRAKAKPSLVIDEQDGGYDISPPLGFTVHLRHPLSCP
jgi:hypothetical protein